MSIPTDQYFKTQAPLVAAWLLYSRRLQYVRYEATTKHYFFYDPDGLSHRLIHEFDQVDPTVSLKRFHRTYKNVLAEKMREDGRAKAQRVAQ